jgi:hypothetical protein
MERISEQYNPLRPRAAEQQRKPFEVRAGGSARNWDTGGPHGRRFAPMRVGKQESAFALPKDRPLGEQL